MSNNTKKPVALAVCTALAGGLLLSGSAFASTQLAQGYLLGADASAGHEKAGEGKCGEGKCGEGSCGMDMMDTNKDGMISGAEHAAAAQAKFVKADANKDGMVSAAEMKAMHEAKCGEGKCGADKAKTEGKCGEGKCGGSI